MSEVREARADTKDSVRDELVDNIGRAIAQNSDEWDFRKQANAALQAIKESGYLVLPREPGLELLRKARLDEVHYKKLIAAATQEGGGE